MTTVSPTGYRNISPIWVSDDHGGSYRLTAMLPRGLPQVQH